MTNNIRQSILCIFCASLMACCAYSCKCARNNTESNSTTDNDIVVSDEDSTVEIKSEDPSFDKNVFEALTPEEVSRIRETTPSFVVFYDKLRPSIFSSSLDHDKIYYKNVSYRSLFDMFKYWESSELQDSIASMISSYISTMTRYQAQVDSISDSYRSIINSIKIVGVPEYDYSKIFNHPELCYFDHDDRINTQFVNVAFTLPIKNQQLFDEIGFEKLTFIVCLTEKKHPTEEYVISTGPVKGDTKHFKSRHTMKLYDYSQWSLLDPKKNYAYGYGNVSNGWDLIFPEYDDKMTRRENFVNVFDWYYEVEECTPSYRQFIGNKIPETVFRYLESQEGSNLDKYISARNSMIVEYCNPDFEPLSRWLPNLIEKQISEKYPKEYFLYQKIKKGNERSICEFESFYDKYEIPSEDWVSPNLELPINQSGDNLIIQTYEYDRRIFRGQVN